MTGNPYFGLRFYGATDLTLGQITMNLSGGMGIRFDRDQAANKNVKMGTVRVTGASSHAIETFNIDTLNIDAVYATNCGESGLLIQTSTNVWVGLVNGQNVGTGTGYATLRFANRNGRLSSGSYSTNGMSLQDKSLTFQEYQPLISYLHSLGRQGRLTRRWPWYLLRF